MSTAVIVAPGTAGQDFGKLLLRMAVGGLMLFHGIKKIGTGVEGMKPMLAAKGLPEAMAYGVYVGEVLAPALILIGLFTRPAAAILAFNMLMAIYIAHMGDIGKVDPMSGGWVIETPMFYLLCSLAIIGIGPGRFSVTGGRGRWWK